MDSGRVLKKSWELSRQNKKLYIAPLVIFLIYIVVILTFIGLVLFIGNYVSIFNIIETINPDDSTKILTLRLILLFFVVFFLPAYLLSPLVYYQDCVIGQGIIDRERGKITFRNVFYQPLRRLGPILILSYMFPLLTLIGIIFFVLPGLLVIYLAPITFMALIKGNNIRESLKNALNVIKKAPGDFILLILFLFGIGAVAGLIFNGLYLIGYLFLLGSLALEYWSAKIIGIGIMAILLIFVTVFWVFFSIFQKIAMMTFYLENTQEKAEMKVEIPKISITKTLSFVGGFVVILSVLSFLITGLLVLPIIGIHNIDDFKVSMGIYHASEGRHEKAITLYDGVLKNDDAHQVAWNEKGESLFELGRKQEALEAFERTLQINPQYPPALFKKSYLLEKLDRNEEALEDIDKYLKLRPDEATGWVNRGWTLHKLGRLEDAIESYEKALEIRPRYKLALSNLGYALMAQGKYNQAIEVLDKALDIDPNYTWALINRGDVLIKMGRYEEALELYDKVMLLGSGEIRTKIWKEKILLLQQGARPYSTVFKKSDTEFGIHRGALFEWMDCNNDGYLDLAYDASNYQNSLFFINDRNGSFSEAQEHELHITSLGDFDNDGDSDIFTCNHFPPPLLSVLINDGNCNFSKKYGLEYEKIRGTGGPECAGEWRDYNNDSLRDLIVIRNIIGSRGNTTIHLFTNNGTDLISSVIYKDGPLYKRDYSDIRYFGEFISWGDYNSDNYLDFAIGNVGQNYLFRNNGDKSFTRIKEFGEGFTKIIKWADYNKDGNLDLAVGNKDQDYLYINKGDGTFTPLLTFNEGDTRGMAWGDYDNDGDLDLALVAVPGDLYLGYIAYPFGYIYENNGGKNFSVSIFFEDIGDGRGVAFGDYDNDGDLDLAMGQYMFTNIKNEG